MSFLKIVLIGLFVSGLETKRVYVFRRFIPVEGTPFRHKENSNTLQDFISLALYKNHNTRRHDRLPDEADGFVINKNHDRDQDFIEKQITWPEEEIRHEIPDGISDIKPKEKANRKSYIQVGASACSKVVKKECLRDALKGLIKCKRACNRAHEDVCDRLACSKNAQINLSRECDHYCEKAFDDEGTSCSRRSFDSEADYAE